MSVGGDRASGVVVGRDSDHQRPLARRPGGGQVLGQGGHRRPGPAVHQDAPPGCGLVVQIVDLERDIQGTDQLRQRRTGPGAEDDQVVDHAVADRNDLHARRRVPPHPAEGAAGQQQPAFGCIECGQVPVLRHRGDPTGISDGRPELPVAHLRHVLEVLHDVLLVPGELRLAPPHQGARAAPGHLHVVQRVHHQVVARRPVAHHHVERRGGGALLDEAADPEPVGVGPAVHELVDRTRVAVEGEDHVDVCR